MFRLVCPLLVLAAACGSPVNSPPEAGEGSPGEAPSSGSGVPPVEGGAALPERVAIRHIVIAWDGARAAPLGTSMDRKEAEAKAASLRDELLKGGDMAALAKKHSSDGSARRGGFLGSSDPGGWVPAFSEAAFSLPLHGVSQVVETAFGFHVLRREPLQEVRLMHMMAQHKDAQSLSLPAKAAGRTPEEARARMAEALEALLGGEAFEEVAAKFSDGPMGVRGADLGWFTRGEIGPSFDEQVFALAPGERSDIIETPFGYHIVRRTE
jgi:parvulin-like peptidyl-prolyl isomerase